MVTTTEKALKARLARMDQIRSDGVEFYLSPANRFQHDLIEADVAKMIEDNMDILIDAADTKKDSINVGALFSRQ